VRIQAVQEKSKGFLLKVSRNFKMIAVLPIQEECRLYCGDRDVAEGDVNRLRRDGSGRVY
jgi:hypothetical protein